MVTIRAATSPESTGVHGYEFYINTSGSNCLDHHKNDIYIAFILTRKNLLTENIIFLEKNFITCSELHPIIITINFSKNVLSVF